MHQLTVSLLRLLAHRQARLLIALDWTEWGESRHSLLVAAVVAGTRAIPVRVASFFDPREIVRSQNARENFFVARLVHALKEAGTTAVLLCDRGFRRASLLQHLEQLEQPFVVRLGSDVWVHRWVHRRVHRKGELEGELEGEAPGRLRDEPLAPGTALDLGRVQLRKDRAVELRVVGIWATGQKAPWWLATNLFDASLLELSALYDRRMAVEEQFRDVKGSRFGVQLRWTQIRTPRHLSRLVLLVGAAAVLWTAVGAAVRARWPKAQLSARGKGARLSLLKLGIYFLERLRRSRRIGIRFIQWHLPPPTLRSFLWLSTASP